MSEPNQPLKVRVVQIEEGTFYFLISECNEVNRLMDLAEVPREHEDGSRLSMAQRVRFYCESMEQVFKEWMQLGRDLGEEDSPPDTAH